MKVNRKFRKLSVADRLHTMREAGYLSDADCEQWLAQTHCLELPNAERMIENVIGTFVLPEGVAINFPVNGKNYLVPLVVEEPSVVAALSYAGLLAEKSGGFTTTYSGTVISGQIQLVDIIDTQVAITAIYANKTAILHTANSLMPNMVARGGGARTLSAYSIIGPQTGEQMVVVKIDIDTQDAMGANIVNSVCEGLGQQLEVITNGRALLKILSNLADQSIVKARVSFSPAQLAVQGITGEAVRDDIVRANDFALADPYRAATHNKGIMNGIDPVAIATGNDWRSIEAAAHAYAARDGQYKALTQWTVDQHGELVGEIELPIKVGTVGASLLTNPTVAYNQRILGISSAAELAQVMGAVGLAQNFAALRALVTSGIQQGHMTLHARSVALTANTPDALFDEVVKQLVDCGEIKVWKAHEIIAVLSGQ